MGDNGWQYERWRGNGSKWEVIRDRQMQCEVIRGIAMQCNEGQFGAMRSNPEQCEAMEEAVGGNQCVGYGGCDLWSAYSVSSLYHFHGVRGWCWR